MKKQFSKTVFLSALAAMCFACSNAASASSFTELKNLVGCGTIKSVRQVNQAPLYDAWYQLKHGGNKSLVELAVSLSPLGNIGIGTAAVGGALIDVARGPSSDVDGVKPPATGEWTDIVAVQILMDSGESLNLPLTAATTRFTNATNYQVGMIVSIFHIPEKGSIQVSTKAQENISREDYESKKGRYRIICQRRVSEDVAAKVFAVGANLVQEDKIILTK